MNDLSRNLLDAAREGLSPDAAAMARVRAKVAASVAASAAVTTTAPTASAVAAPVKATTGLGIKLGIGALVVAALGGALIATRSKPSTDSARISITSSDRDEAHDVVRVSSAEPRVAVTEEPTRPARKPAPVAAPAPPVASEPAPAAEPISLSREVELIDKAMLFVRRGDARDAIGVIAMFERETHGQGQMAEDASAIEIEARCRLHEDVGSAMAAFDRRWPSSAQRSRLQHLCFARK